MKQIQLKLQLYGVKATVNIHVSDFLSLWEGMWCVYCLLFVFSGHSVEKDGSALSDEKQTIQTSLFSLLKDFLKSPTQEELHTVLAYILTVGEEKQVSLLSV